MAMITFADVYIWGQHAGAVAWDETRQAGSFEYTAQFAESGLDLSPLMMPPQAHGLRGTKCPSTASGMTSRDKI